MRPLSSAFRMFQRILPWICLSVLLAAGCGSGVGKTVPVSGTVTVLGQAVTTGSVAFIPDTTKGNTSKVEPAATIGSDGKYILKTNGKDGAPAGWYKVVVVAEDVVDNTNPTPANSKVNAIYKSAETTPLSLEVKEGAAANAYDLSLNK